MITDREEALNWIKDKIDFILNANSVCEEGSKYILSLKQQLPILETITRALTKPEPEVVSVEDIVDNIGSIEYEYESPYQTINTSIDDRVAKIVVNYLDSNYPNGIIIRSEENE